MTSLPKKHILLLGGFGFIGTNFMKYVEARCPEKYTFTVMDRFPTHPAGIAFSDINKVYDGDFSDRNLIERIFEENTIDLIIHSLSAITPSSVCDNETAIRQSVLPTLQLLEIMDRHKVRDILYLSSGGAVYGDASSDKSGHAETEALYPRSAYGLSKVAVEKALFQFSELHGFRTLILRPSNPYGPYHYSKTQGIVNIAIEKALQHETFEVWGNGEGKKDYIYVGDLSEIMLKLIEKGLAPLRIVNVGSGEILSVNEILSAIRSMVSPSFAWQYKEANKNDVQSFRLNLERLAELLPDYRPTSFREGLKRTLDWYKTRQKPN